MAFCINCGRKIEEGAKYCSNCGISVTTRTYEEEEKRKTVYEGEIHKCPNCGEILESFAANCPSCGYEVRGRKASETVQEFALRLQQASTDEQRITFIRNYPISNVKEDIFEFMILASTNISGEYNEIIFNAWLAKIEQCYQKAKLVFENDEDFTKIQSIYEQTNKQITKERVAHSANKMGKLISKFTETFPNPVFGIVVALLGFYEVVRIFKGDFVGIDIIIAALILWFTYKIANRKDKKK